MCPFSSILLILATCITMPRDSDNNGNVYQINIKEGFFVSTYSIDGLFHPRNISFSNKTWKI